jgi:hypothetical protein
LAFGHALSFSSSTQGEFNSARRCSRDWGAIAEKRGEDVTIAPEFSNRFGGDARRWIRSARFLSRTRLAGTQIGKLENIVAKAEMTKTDKVDKTDKVEMTKNDKADMTKADVTKIDFDAMSIEELAALRDNAGAKLLEKVTARQVELEAEIERLSQYGKQSKKAAATAPVTKPRKGQGKAGDASDGSDTPVPAAA